MPKFWKNAVILSIAEIILKLKAFVMMPLITGYFGAMDYGIWSQVTALVSTLGPLVFLGTDSAMMRFLPGQDIKTQRSIFSGWLVFGFGMCFFIISIILFAEDFFANVFFGKDPEYKFYIPLAIGTLFVTTLFSGIRLWYRVMNQAKSLVAITVIQTILAVIITIWVLWQKLSLYTLILYTLYGEILLLLFYVYSLFREKSFSLPQFDFLKTYLKFGIVVLPAGYAVWALNFSDRLFLVHYHTMSDIGIYAIAFTIGYAIIQLIVNPIWNLFPSVAAKFYSEGELDKIQKLYDQSLKIIALTTFPSVIGLYIVGKDFLWVFTSESFVGDAITIPMLLFGYLLHMISSYYEIALSLKIKQHLGTVSIVLATLINIILNFLLIPQYSYVGAAAATMLSYLTQFLLNYYFQRRVGILIMDWGFLGKIILVTAAMGVGCYYLRQSLISFNVLLRLVVVSLSGIPIYVMLLFGLKIISINEILQWKGFAVKRLQGSK